MKKKKKKISTLIRKRIPKTHSPGFCFSFVVDWWFNTPIKKKKKNSVLNEKFLSITPFL